VAAPTPPAPPGDGSADEASFSRDAERAGLRLPVRHPLRPWLAVAVVVAIVAAAVGVGAVTGWAVGPRHATGYLTVYGAQDCSAAIAPVTVNLSGTVASDAGSSWAGTFEALGAAFSLWTGGCVEIAVVPSAGDGYEPELADRSTFFQAGSLPPNATDRATLADSVATTPSALLAVDVVYDLAGLSSPLRLNASVLSGIYSGSITSWSSPAIAALNPGVDLASAPAISPLYRSGSAGVNLPFTSYLADGSAAWSTDVGHGLSVAWPAGNGVSNSTAMASEIAATPGAIGYLESVVSVPANSSVAALATENGTFVLPSSAGVTAAAAAVSGAEALGARDWANLSIVDAPGAGSYPLVEVAYATMYANLGTAYSGSLSFTNATWLVSFFWWLVSNASTSMVPLGLTPLPTPFEGAAHSTLENETYNSIYLIGDSESGGGETGEF
jgi:phosphate transport system substrate-binding protein